MRKANDIISGLFNNHFGKEFVESARSSAQLFTSWESIVTEIWPKGADHRKGDIPAAAVHSKIRELEKGILFIEADHPGWIQILQTKQAGLLQTVQRRHPELDIRGIAFILSRGSANPPVVQSSGPEPAVTISQHEPIDLAPRPQLLQDEHKERKKNKDPNEPRDEEFYAALKSLEKSVMERNKEQ